MLFVLFLYIYVVSLFKFTITVFNLRAEKISNADATFSFSKYLFKSVIHCSGYLHNDFVTLHNGDLSAENEKKNN